MRALDWVVHRPLLAAALIGAVTVLLALQLPRLRIDTSLDGFMVAGDPARQQYEQFKATFGGDDFTMVLVRAEDVFAPSVLAIIGELSSRIEALEGVRRVESLATVRTITGDGEALVIEPLVGDRAPSRPDEVARIRADALGDRLLVGNLVAPDGRAAAVIAHLDPPAGDAGFNRRFVAALDALIGELARPGVEIFQLGRPFFHVAFADGILADLLTLTPLSLALLFAILSLAFRMLHAVAIPILTAALGVVWALGLMALLDLPLTLLTVTVPALVIVIGTTEDVHLMAEYHRLLARGHGKPAALAAMLRQGLLPIFITTVTTVVGFGSLVTSSIPSQFQFGLASALALTANFVVTMLGLPTLLALWPLPRRLRPAPGGAVTAGAALRRGLVRLGALDLRYRAWIAAGAGLVTAGALVGWASLQVLSIFPAGSEVRRRADVLHRSLTGHNTFHVVVESGREGGLKDPALLDRIVELQAFLEARDGVDRTLSVADSLRRMHRAVHGGDPALETIPRSQEEVAQYLLLLEGEELAQRLDFDASSASILVRHHLSSSWQLAALLEALAARTAALFPADARVHVTGEGILIHHAADVMAVTELTSFSSAFLIISAIHAVFFRSLRIGLLSMVPNLVPVLFNFGVMGLLGIPLNMATAMIATIAIGIAVDDTVHYVVAYRRHLGAGHDPRAATLATLADKGPPILYSSLALAGGFAVLAGSSFVPIVHFGVLSAVVMLLALGTELALTPVVMAGARLPAARPSPAPGWWRRRVRAAR